MSLFKVGLNALVPVHVLLFSFTWGGASFYSFVASPIAFKHLPREEFGRLQNQIFPFFFLGQTVTPLLLGLTSPFVLSKAAIAALSVSALGGAANYFWLLPVCQKLKEQRLKLVADKAHETLVDGKAVPTAEYERLTKQFGKYHGISLLANTVSIVLLGIYGILLAKTFKL